MAVRPSGRPQRGTDSNEGLPAFRTAGPRHESSRSGGASVYARAQQAGSLKLQRDFGLIRLACAFTPSWVVCLSRKSSKRKESSIISRGFETQRTVCGSVSKTSVIRWHHITTRYYNSRSISCESRCESGTLESCDSCPRMYVGWVNVALVKGQSPRWEAP